MEQLHISAKHLAHLGKEAAHFFHTPEHDYNKSFPSLEDHELVHEDNHEMILNFFQAYAKEHPELAHNLANKVMKICEDVLATPEHHEHHHHAKKLKATIQKIHQDVETVTNHPNAFFNPQTGECLFDEAYDGHEREMRLKKLSEAHQFIDNFISKTHKRAEKVTMNISTPSQFFDTNIAFIH